MEGKGRVALSTIGDAATRQGEFYEAVSFALQAKLPAVFVVEDNGYGISTPTADINPYAIAALDKAHMVLVNGRDPFEVFEKGGEAVAKARAGEGPTVLWCELDRIAPHTSSDDHRIYRSAEELAEAVRRDPITTLASRLIDEGQLTEDAWGAMQKRVRAEVDADYAKAEAAADPDPKEITQQVHGSLEAPENGFDLVLERATMVAAVNGTLRAALDGDEKVVVFGEDVEDPKGGVFGFTKGLSSDFAGRVVNAPLAEATILGVGVGMASAGWKPVFELQFIDFLPPALNQLITHVSCLRWRTNGDWTCPLVLIMPYGAYLPGGGVWHSESKEGLLAHIPGIHVVVPSTPADTAGLLWSAIHCGDPVLFLLPKHLFRQPFPPLTSCDPVPLGKAAVRRSGQDVTLVTWGNCVELAEKAADEMAENEVSVEIVDLRTITPCDWATIERSLEKTGRLVVVHEDNRTGGFGEAIVAEATSCPARWDLFLAPPQIVARTDTFVPYNPTLEYTVLPDLRQVLEAIHVTLE